MASTLLARDSKSKAEKTQQSAMQPGGHQRSASAINHSEIYYPESDGEPIAETGIHVHAILSFYGWLYAIFHKRNDIWVAANMFLYYKKGDPKRRKAPDVMVVKGVENRFRRTFKTWEENAVPSVVFEFTSKGTIDEDTIVKSSLYSSLGIKEYFLFDPEADYLDEQFIGYRLVDGEYGRITDEEDGILYSEEMELRLKPVGKMLRVFNPLTNELMPEFEDINEYATNAVQRAAQESNRADQAEAELAKALAELAELKRKSQN